MKKFGGFPDGAFKATPIPNQFFAEVLPEIESLAELRATLYVLWRTAPGPKSAAWLPLDELRPDPELAKGAEEAVERGTLLKAVVQYKDLKREVVAPNTGRGRRGLATLRDRAPSQSAPPLVVAPDGRPSAERPDIFALYEQNVGLVQPLIAEELRAAAELYPAAWIEEAFRQAVAYNRRNWRYVKRILERWALDGREADATARGRAAPSTAAEAKRQWSSFSWRDGGVPDV